MDSACSQNRFLASSNNETSLDDLARLEPASDDNALPQNALLTMHIYRLTKLILQNRNQGRDHCGKDNAALTECEELVVVLRRADNSQISMNDARIEVATTLASNDNNHNKARQSRVSYRLLYANFSLLLAVAPPRLYVRLMMDLCEILLNDSANEASSVVVFLCYELLFWGFRLKHSSLLPVEQLTLLLGQSVRLDNSGMQPVTRQVLLVNLFQHLFRAVDSTDRRQVLLEQLDFKRNAYLWNCVPVKLIPKRMLTSARADCELLLHRIVMNSSVSDNSYYFDHSSGRRDMLFMFQFYLQFLWNYLRENRSLDAVKPLLAQQVESFLILKDIVLRRYSRLHATDATVDVNPCLSSLLYVILPLSVFFLFAQKCKEEVRAFLVHVAQLLDSSNTGTHRKQFGLEISSVKMLLIFSNVFIGESLTKSSLMKKNMFPPLCAIFQQLFKSERILTKLLVCKVFSLYSSLICSAGMQNIKFQQHASEMVPESEKHWVAYYIELWTKDKPVDKVDEYETQLCRSSAAIMAEKNLRQQLWNSISKTEVKTNSFTIL